jgi:peroxiredoxin
MGSKQILVYLLMLLMVACNSKQEKAEAPVLETKPAEVTNDLPQMFFVMLDGSHVKAKELQGNTVLVLFQPDCDHCQREAQQIKEHIEAFRNYTVYFVSMASMPELEAFAKKYELNGFSNVRFGTTDLQSILDNFGSVSAPSVYVYNGSGKLTAKFNGETDINKILSSI